MIKESLLYGIAIPIFASVVVLGLFLLANRKQKEGATLDSPLESKTAWLGALALGLSYCSGYVGLLGWPAFPGIEASQWIFWFVPVALGLSLLDTAWRIPSPPLWGLRAASLGAMLYLMFRSQVENEVWTQTKLATNIAWMTIVGIILWVLWEQIAKQISEAKLGWLLMIFSIATSVSLVLSSTAKLAQLCGAMVSGIGLWWVLSWLSQSKGLSHSFAKGILPIYVTLFVGLLFNGYYYAEVSNLTAGLLGASVLLLWIVTKFLKPEKNWQQILLYSFAVLAPISGGLVNLILQEMNKPKNPYLGVLSSLGLG